MPDRCNHFAARFFALPGKVICIVAIINGWVVRERNVLHHAGIDELLLYDIEMFGHIAPHIHFYQVIFIKTEVPALYMIQLLKYDNGAYDQYDRHGELQYYQPFSNKSSAARSHFQSF